MFLTKTADLIYDALLTIAYPNACSLCSRSVETRRWGPACIDCWRATQVFDGSEAICWKCGSLAREAFRPVNPENIRCNRCADHLFVTARSCGVYEGALRESVLRLKRQPTIPLHLTTLLVNAARQTPLAEATRLIPVPLHPDRERQRGFNQATIIARILAAELNLIVDETSLTRTVSSEKYRAGLDVKGRHDTVSEAFAVTAPRVLKDESILLVDDVFTTGATASSCAETLLAAGVSEVHVLTIARPR